MRQPSCSIVVVGLVITCIGSTVAAQSVLTGALTGTLTDPSTKATQTVTVVARNVDTKREVTATADNEGRFRIVGLQPGNYIVEVTRPGVTSRAIAQVVIEVGRVTTVNMPRDSAAANSRVAPHDMSDINTTRQDFALYLNQTSFDALPNNGRRWSNFAILAPATTPGGPFGAVRFRGINSLLNDTLVDGGDNDQTFLATERGGTRIAYGIGLASIRDVQIKIADYSAEYGGAAGGMITAVTKSGTNTFHGSAFLYDRDNRWGARNPRGFQSVLLNGASTLVALKPVDTRYQFGGGVGGPLLENRLFFFGSYDQQRRNFPAISTPSDPRFFDTVDRAGLNDPRRGVSDAQIDETLAFLRTLTGEVPRRGDQTIYTPRVDWQMTSGHTLSATFNRVRWNSPAGLETAPTINRGRASVGDDFVNIDWITVSVLSRVSPRLVNEWRSQFGRDHQSQFSQTPAPGEPLTGPQGKPPSISFAAGTFSFGKRNELDARAVPDEKRWQYADTVTLTLRNHLVKVGFDFSRVNIRRDNLPAEGGTYAYENINDFIVDYVNFTAAGALRAAGRVCVGSARIAGQCYTGPYNQSFGRAAFGFTANDYSVFIQDDYRLSGRVTLNFGLRYEYQQLPEPQVPNKESNSPDTLFGPEQTHSFPSDKNDVEPRLGFVYDVHGSGKTTIRGGYGVHHGRIPNAAIAHAINSTGSADSQRTFQLNPASSASVAPVFPNTLAGPPGAAVPPNMVLFDPELQRPSVRAGSVVFDHSVGSNTVFSAAYLFSAGRGLPTFIDVNLPAPTSRTYSIIGGAFDGQTLTVSPFFVSGSRPDRRFGIITAIRSLITSKHHALAVQLNRRLTKGLQFDGSYTLSKATDNGQSSAVLPGTNYPSNPFDLSADQGPSDFDVRHKFTASAVWSPVSRSANHRLADSFFSGFTVSTVFFAMSGAPYSAGVRGATERSLRAGITGGGLPSLSRLPLLSRNTFRMPTIVNVDLRISRRFRMANHLSLEVLGEAFNLFNRTQVTELNTAMYVAGGSATASTLVFDPAFQTVSAAGNNIIRERQLQFAIRMGF